jgi:hypothetical protein
MTTLVLLEVARDEVEERVMHTVKPYVGNPSGHEPQLAKPAEASFRQGWQEVIFGQTRPVSELWDGIDTA